MKRGLSNPVPSAHLRDGVREVRRHRQPSALSTGIQPIREACPQGVAQVAFVRPGGRQRKNRLAMTAQEAQVSQNVLPVFRPGPHYGLPVVRSNPSA